MSHIEINELKTGIFSLVLNRPDKGNAFDDAMIDKFIQALKQLENSLDVRIVVLSANGKHFCTGADLSWMQRMVNFSYEENVQDAKKLAQLYQSLNAFPKPVIACVHGASYGGGLGLIACADIAIAHPDSVFCFSEVKLGLVPATIAPYVLNAIGPHHARRYFLTAEQFNADTAKEIGLVYEIKSPTAREKMVDIAIPIAESMLNNGSIAMARSKQLINNLYPITASIQQQTAELIAQIRTSDEAQTRLRAFLDWGL